MGFKEASGYCSYCGENVLIRAKTPNHILHLILSFVTSGLWLVVWIILGLSAKEWRCCKCGHEVHLGGKGSVGGTYSNANNHYTDYTYTSNITGPNGKKVKICMHCGAKNRAEDYTCISCSKPV